MTVPDPLSPIAAALDGAEPVAGIAPGPVTDTVDHGGDDAGSGEGSATRRRRTNDGDAMYPWRDDCPVEPLGKYGTAFYYLDGDQQLVTLGADKHGRAYIFALFGDKTGWLMEHYGKRAPGQKDGTLGHLKGGFHADDVANVLMKRAGTIGIIDPAKTVRGCGAWPDEKGALVLHLGDRVWIGGEYRKPGRYGAHVYPAMPATLRPASLREGGDAAGELLDILRTWHWKHPLMPMLVFGWIVQGFVAGAVDWRAHMYASGGRGTGKSTLEKLISGLFGTWMLTASDATPAALYQLMAARAQPVFIDEFEAGANPKRKAAIIEVLRQASSGGRVLRGGDTGVGKEFSIQFPGFLTSIVALPLLAQDESRFVRAELLALADHPRPTTPPDLSPALLGKMGSRLLRRMVDQWPRWGATLKVYRATLEAVGAFDARAQDTFGTLLACADLALYDTVGGPADDDGDDPIEALCAGLATMVAPARAEALEDQDRCLAHLLQSQIDRGGGQRRSVASWLRQASLTEMDDRGGQRPTDHAKEAWGALGACGVKYERGRYDGAVFAAAADGVRFVTVGNNHPSLVRLFQDTPWPGQVGTTGAWVATLRRVTGAMPTDNGRIGGIVQRGTRVPVEAIVDWGDEA